MTLIADGIDEFELANRPPPKKRMTEKEFLNWVGEKTRAEWVGGEVIMMSPVNLDHARISSFLARVLAEFVEAGDLGEVIPGEFLVRLGGAQPQDRLPDLLFVSTRRQRRLKHTYVEGAPDLIIEVVSPDSVARDLRDKYLAYEAGGVDEYWVVDPIHRQLEAYALGRDKKYRRLAESEGAVASKLLKGFFLKPVWVFAPKPISPSKALKEMGIRG